MSDSLWPHGLQHVRPPCPSPTPRTYSNSCPSCQWCQPTISSSVVLFFDTLRFYKTHHFFQNIVYGTSVHKYWCNSMDILKCHKFIFLLTAALISHIEQVLAHYINQIVYVPVLKVFLRVQWTIDLRNSRRFHYWIKRFIFP